MIKKDYNFVIIECNCERQQICVADEHGEDLRAFDLMDEYKLSKCNKCGMKYSTAIIYQNKDTEEYIQNNEKIKIL